ncbi:hypothetical protein [Actinoplanes sp. NPDC023714]|uniref:pentapeptide repeat-containing protein n=1 Tax=Actinoplanes sp. NPDC023714 TaxID=3154322 RepID=UPI00340F4853
MLIVAGASAVGAAAVQRWRRGRTRQSRPVAERVPLFGHVAAVLLLAAIVAAFAGLSLWWVFGHLHPAGAAGSTPTSIPAGPAVWSVQNSFEAIKIVLALVAGIGGVVALTVAYRKQDHGEAAEHRENTKLFNERFGKAAEQLGSDKVAVRLAGVYAMAGLADDWAEGRQTCIDVLCGYLRMPYTPPDDDTASTPKPAAQESPAANDRRSERQVRQTIISLIRDHLLLGEAAPSPRASWHGRQFNLRGATLDGGNLAGIVITRGTLLDFTGANFPSDTVSFDEASLAGGIVFFTDATFSGGTVSFADAKLSTGRIGFTGARFSGGGLSFVRAMLSGGELDFLAAEFSAGRVHFTNAKFDGSWLLFQNVRFAGSRVYFASANFSDGGLRFDHARFENGEMHFTNARFGDGAVSFIDASFSGCALNFTNAWFTGGAVNFADARITGGPLDFRRPESWAVPPLGIARSNPNVLWPSPQELKKDSRKPGRSGDDAR